MDCKSIIFSVDPSFFLCDCGDQKSFQSQQRNEANNGTDIIYWTVLPAGF